ncbi:hypothetical protein EP331_12240 [bacterium]|nr:MAG: hypothetical protein EP331_12240 [bacterium]
MSAQSLDDWFISKSQSLLSTWLNDSNIDNRNVFITSSYSDFTFFLEQSLAEKGYQVKAVADSNSTTVNVEFKGEFQVNGKQVFADGVILFKQYVNNNLEQSKRFVIKEHIQSVSTEPYTSSYWKVIEAEKSASGVKKWLEPGLILSAMAVTIYLLFAVRS